MTDHTNVHIDNQMSYDPNYKILLPEYGGTSCFVHQIFGYRPNWHDNHYEMNIVLKGKVEFYADGVKETLCENGIFFINPSVCHASYPIDQNSITLVTHIPVSLVNELLGIDQIQPFHIDSNDETLVKPLQKLRILAAEMFYAFQTDMPDKVSQSTLRSTLGMMISILYRYFRIDDQEMSEFSSIENRNLVTSISNYIGDHYMEKIKLQDISDTFGYNRSYISTLIKKTMGNGFQDYVNLYRLRAAVFELSNFDKTLLEIALECGFTDLNTFNQLFKSIFGVYPKIYRRRMLAELEQNNLIPTNIMTRKYLTIHNPEVSKKLSDYLL